MKAFKFFFLLLLGVPSLLLADVVVTQVTGTVLVYLPGSNDPVQVSSGDSIPSGARVVTGTGAQVRFRTLNNVTSTIESGSDVTVTESPSASGTATAVFVSSGTVASDTSASTNPSDYTVSSPDGAASGDFQTTFTVSVSTGANSATSTNVSATSGSVQVTDNSGTTTTVNDAVTLGGTEPAPPAPIVPPPVIVDTDDSTPISPF